MAITSWWRKGRSGVDASHRDIVGGFQEMREKNRIVPAMKEEH